MVRLAEESEYRYQGYLENNRDLARKVSELEQQLNLTTQEIHLLRSILHQKDVKILELESQVNELQQYKAKHDFIKDIILGDRPVESAPHSIIHQTTSIQAITDTEHTETSRKENDTCQQEEHSEQPTTRDILQPIAESDEEEGEGQQSPDSTEDEGADDQEQEAGEDEDDEEEETLEAIEEEDEGEEQQGHEENWPIQHNQQANSQTPTRIEDSLEPVNVTYVPPINQPERTCHTPSIWNCLDSIKSDESVKSTPHSPVRSGLKVSQTMNSSSPIHPIINRGPLNEEVFHSTPVQPVRLTKPKPKRANQRSENEAPCTRYNLRKRAKVAN